MIQITDEPAGAFKFANNNNIIEFNEDTIGSIVEKAEISILTNLITLYPRPSGQFWYNFQNIFKSLFVDIDDDLEVDLLVAFVYDWDKPLKNIDINIDLFYNQTFSELTLNYNILNAGIDLIENKRKDLQKNTFDVLTPKNGDDFYRYFVNYWEGFPFDLTLLGDGGTSFEYGNFSLSFTINTIGRFIFSDGEADVTIQNLSPLLMGFNSVEYSDFFFGLEKKRGCPDGVYVKFLNSFGGWSYWLFDKGEIRTKTKDKGIINNDFENTNNTISQFVSLGKEGASQLKVKAYSVKEYENRILLDLAQSSKVYLFTGLPFAKNNFQDWIEIVVKDKTHITTSPRREIYNVEFDFVLTSSYNR